MVASGLKIGTNCEVRMVNDMWLTNMCTNPSIFFVSTLCCTLVATKSFSRLTKIYRPGVKANVMGLLLAAGRDFEGNLSQ